MRDCVLRRMLWVIAPAVLTLLVASCDKTAENTNRPVIIQGFDFTVDGTAAVPAGTLQMEPGSVLTIKVTYTDPDAGENPDQAWYSFTWAVERVGGGTGTFNPNDFFIVLNENPCIWTAPSVTGFYRFLVEVRDYYGTPSQETVVVEVNANKQPVITGLEISNNSPFVNEEITITVEANDPDGNLPIEYEWQANGGYFTSEGEGEAKWLSPAPGSFQITLIVSDQAGGNVSRIVPIIVQENHAPVVQGWDLDPGNSVTLNQLVTITIEATDDDNDPLEYNWTADKGTFNSVNQYVAVWRAPNEAISCKITCTVEDNKGASDSAEIIINVTSE